MGYSGKWGEKLRAQNLRRQGLSYQEILQSIPVSKGTLSNWCKDIELLPTQKERLAQNKLFGQKRGSLIAADRKRILRVQRTQEIYKISLQEVGPLMERDHFMLGLALYAAEGDKTDRKGAFTNADPRLIKFMMEWFLTDCNLPLSKLRGAIWIHEGNDEFKAKQYWSILTGIPVNQFHKTYISKVKTDSKNIRKNIHPNGVFAIRFTDSATHRKIMGWISAVFGATMMQHSAIAQR